MQLGAKGIQCLCKIKCDAQRQKKKKCSPKNAGLLLVGGAAACCDVVWRSFVNQSVGLSVCQLRTFYERKPGGNIYISARVEAVERMRSLCLGETKVKSLVQHLTAMRGLQSTIIFRSLF